MADPIRQWLRARPPMTDLAVALVCFVLVAPFAAATAYHRNASIPVYLVLLAISCVPLLVRSRWPVQVAAATVLIGVVEFVLVPVDGPPPGAVGFALYAVATRTDRRTAWRTGLCAAVALTLAGLVSRPGVEELPQNLGLIAWTSLSVAVGDAVRSRRELLATAMERAERAERTREEEARRRVTEERMRIARELHDVVAHHITLVNAQAGVAHHLMRTDPEHAYQALERIRDTSRAALDELRATVGLLRNSGEQAAPREPAPGLAGLDDLLEAFRHSGLPVRLERVGPVAGLPPITDLTAYRIIQEALTNTHKHAGPVGARVRLEFGTDTLRLTVEDDGRAPAGGLPPGTGPGAGTGHGMIGMHERARAAGGTLAAGPRPGGGFRVHAELPLPAGRPKGLLSMTIRVLLADDQALLRGTFRMLIDSAPDLEVVAEAGTGREAVRLARTARVDLVLMDIRMPELDGLEATRLITADEDLAGVKVLVLTTFESEEYVAEAIRAGASGFLGKGINPEELLEAIRVVAAGDALLSPAATKALIGRFLAQPAPADRAALPRLDVLTAREQEVVTLVAAGLSNDDIAERLFVTPLTAKTHVNRAMAKLGARDRAQVVVIAYESGLVRPGSA